MDDRPPKHSELVTVGVPHSDYNSKRNILDSLPEGFCRVRPWDVGRVRSAIRWRTQSKVKRGEHFFFREPYFPRADLFHFWNSVADIRKPWITSFEYTVPLWTGEPAAREVYGMSLALRDECRRLIAFSCAAQSAAVKYWVRSLPAAQVDALVNKTEVLLPPQSLVARDRRLPKNQQPTFAFIGKEFYRKGGLEVLEAFATLNRAGRREWRAMVIGDLFSFGDYASKTDQHSRSRAKQLLDGLKPLVQFMPTPVRYEDVLQILTAADFYLLPTYADTFGYTVLEAQACGAVVMATDVGSLPEVVTPDTGVVVPLQESLDGWRVPERNAASVKQMFCERVLSGITACLEMSSSHRDALRNAAWQRLRERHCPKQHSARLRRIYLEALSA